ncbi:histidine phosphatase superfamily (branch 1) domain-containing protein [Ditylenchus destructor]|uniref:Histidine phosphatase superfamily (Branch 1) domain-containing protein n=1 Tax=Ditylenchus destructor TaxID=166010 RepID=A0AAD4N1Y0_9BILA|nr:histidine phosphatase superfamily (branch 1) domain-containing protein [Ditylenchus destructor]
MGRHIWIVRHGERVDNVDPEWRYNAPGGAWDDPPLTKRGHQQAYEVGTHLVSQSLTFDHIISSPFVRCIQTASGLINGMLNGPKSELKVPGIKVEPALCESLNSCLSPPSFQDVEALRALYPHIDASYRPYATKDQLVPEKTSICCFVRMRNVLEWILNKYSGNIILVSHGAPISGLHFALTNQLKYVGQCTISKYQSRNSLENGQANDQKLESSGLFEANSRREIQTTPKKIIELGTQKHPSYKCIAAGDSSHLSDRTLLRDEMFIKESLVPILEKFVANNVCI